MTAGRRAALAACAGAVLVSGLLLAAPMVTSSPSPNAAAAMLPSALSPPGSRSAGSTASQAAAAPQIANDEIVLANLQPSGLPDEVLLISRMLTVDYPEQTVADPASVTNVKYLDRLGRPRTSGSDVLLPVGGEGQRSVLTEARFDKPLPVALHAQYTLNDRVVSPDEIVGASGELQIDYTLTNTTAAEQELTYSDAAGVAHTSKRPVFAPFAGTASVKVPATVEVRSAPGAIRSTDQAGNTILNWNVSLFPPVTSNQQVLVVRTHAQRAAIPAIAVRLMPVTARKDPALEFTADALDSSVTGNHDLYGGLAELDDNAATLAEGAGQLAGGMQTLASGTAEVSDAADQVAGGLGTLVTGADRVATGTAQLREALRGAASGARTLATAAAQLADADTSAAGGALTSLIGGARELTAGATTLAARFGSASDPPLPNPLPAPDADKICQPQLGTSTTTPAALDAAQDRATQPSASGPVASPSTGSDTTKQGAGTQDHTGSSTPSAVAPSASATASASAAPSPTGSTIPYDDDCVTVYQGVRSLVAGLSQIAGLSQVIATEIANANAAATAIRTGLTGITTDTATAAVGAAGLVSQLCGPAPGLPDATCAQLASVAAAAGRAAQGSSAMADPLAALLTSLGRLNAYATILSQSTTASVDAGTSLLVGMDAIAAGLGSGTGAGSSGLVAGLAGLTGGLVKFADSLSSSSAQLSAALEQLATGSGKLAGGVAAAADGASDLATGSEALARGTKSAADGAQLFALGIADLAVGASKTTAGAVELASGARQLQTQGTAAVADSVLTASTGPALAQSWLAAAGARAADALPYGAPDGASGHVAYMLSIPSTDPPAPSLWDRVTQWFGG